MEDEKKTKQFNIMIEPTLYKKIDLLAKEIGENRSVFGRKAIIQRMRRIEKEID